MIILDGIESVLKLGTIHYVKTPDFQFDNPWWNWKSIVGGAKYKESLL